MNVIEVGRSAGCLENKSACVIRSKHTLRIVFSFVCFFKKKKKSTWLTQAGKVKPKNDLNTLKTYSPNYLKISVQRKIMKGFSVYSKIINSHLQRQLKTFACFYFYVLNSQSLPVSTLIRQMFLLPV